VNNAKAFIYHKEFESLLGLKIFLCATHHRRVATFVLLFFGLPGGGAESLRYRLATRQMIESRLDYSAGDQLDWSNTKVTTTSARPC
jgi:hypothetical protein